MNDKKSARRKQIRAAALRLIRDSRFLFRVGQKIREMGIVREQRNSLVLFLAGLTKDLEKPVSVLVKAPSGSGKSDLAKAVVALFPTGCVDSRASLSSKAPAYGEGELKGRILCIRELSGARDALYLTRLLLSDGEIEHEFTAGSGRYRGTILVSRKGSPVVITTTTKDRVYEDDETRFLSLRLDDSPSRVQAVIAAHYDPNPVVGREEKLAVWRKAVRILCQNIPQFIYPPWFTFLAQHIPSQQPRAMRDAIRFLSLLKAVALCRSYSDGRAEKSHGKLRITFADYRVAHLIFNQAFTSTFSSAHPRTVKVAKTVRQLNKQLDRPPSVKEVAKALKWKQGMAYKYVERAIKGKLVKYEPGTRPRNQKRLLPGLTKSSAFLPDPVFIFRKRPDVGDVVRYVDPLTGKSMVQKRKR